MNDRGGWIIAILMIGFVIMLLYYAFFIGPCQSDFCACNPCPGLYD